MTLDKLNGLLELLNNSDYNQENIKAEVQNVFEELDELKDLKQIILELEKDEVIEIVKFIIQLINMEEADEEAYNKVNKIIKEKKKRLLKVGDKVRVNDEGNNVFLSDFTLEGDAYFGGNLENSKYEFNITRYFFQLLNNVSYTKDLYLLPAGAAVNANRTILSKDIKLQIYYSEL